MKITLFTQTTIHEFFLPNQVSGSYSFDQNPEEDYKIINIEAENGKWVIHGNDNVFVFDGNTPVEKKEIVPNNYYLLQRDRINYLIFVTESFETGYGIYVYGNNPKLIIGNDNSCNVTFNCPFLSGKALEIKRVNGVFNLVKNGQILVYRNNEVIDANCAIRTGDKINLYGLKILFLKNTLIINNPCNSVVINNMNAEITPFTYQVEKYKNIEVKDEDLYAKKDYFSKSPRIRRLVEKKPLQIDAPPKPKQNSEVPALLTFGPMITMFATSGISMMGTITSLTSGETTLDKAWPTLATAILGLISSFLWPNLTKWYNTKTAKDERKKIVKLYIKYLEKKEEELRKEQVLQKNIWQENLKTTEDCLSIIRVKKNNFWSKRCEQSDFLCVRVGIGKVPLSIEVKWPEEGFTIEEDNLKDLSTKMIENYKYIDECPLEYNLYENFLTAIMGVPKKRYGFINNILLQLMTYYCYDDLKIVIFTNKENKTKWDYLKYCNYCFTNDKSVRFYAEDIEEARALGGYLIQELQYKKNFLKESKGAKMPPQKPHYLIICDDYSAYKKVDFFKELVELDTNLGYSTIILEDALNKLPSKCINFISLTDNVSGILKNSYEKAEMIEFRDEINYDLNMMDVTKSLSNTPIEIEGAAARLPDSVEFLEMEKVGKVEQLNIMNRWNQNDSTKSLKAEIGVDEEGNFIYLDLHEKIHGPHGLVAGTTGSGKSEFIITYILSLSMNYGPDDVAFILIDYKGGGLAFAFENKLTGVKLPHLAGTITNLDKAEMNRTLVSIDSEVKRRQSEFNKARDLLGESTIDIYKYQRFYHEGKLSEPIPHLFLIADEFAELKSQQPDFMENLISVARIGRSLGVHLILATQKPSGVVDDQIWSNTKFRVCLKVADASDSKEMIKKPDAALLKQSGRFYLQVGMDEVFLLGQSGWAGAKYYPSDIVNKQVDKSINFIDNNGQVIKNISESNNSASKKEAQGEQLAAIMKEIISVATQTNKKAKTLWLDNIPPIILPDATEEKYQVTHTPYKVTATIGEYDAPELQQQGIVTYDYVEQGNLLILGNDGAEREKLINTMVYTTCKHHTADEVNFYAIDFGSESLRMFTNLPQFGGLVFTDENEKQTNLIKMITREMSKRKKMFVDYGGDYNNYIKNSGQKIPIKIVIINNVDTAIENNPDFGESLAEYLRDSARYGIIYIITGNNTSSIRPKTMQNIQTTMAFKLKEVSEYTEALGERVKQGPADILGRGMLNNGGAHEFQTASIVEDEATLSKHILEFIEEAKKNSPNLAQKIPTLPEHVRMEDIAEKLSDLSSVPMGVMRDSLDIRTANLKESLGFVISANKLVNASKFLSSLIKVFAKISVATILIDATKAFADEKSNVSNYFDQNFDEVLDKLMEFVDNNTESESKVVMIVSGVDKLLSKLDDTYKLEELTGKLKKCEKIPFIVIEDGGKLRNYVYDQWYKNVLDDGDGVWVGSGVSEQGVFKTSGYDKIYTLEYPNDMGFYMSEGTAKLIKLLDFVTQDGEEDNEQ